MSPQSILQVVMRALRTALPLALCLFAATGVHAAGVAVAMDHSTRMSLHGVASNVVVGNPAIADVTVVDSHTLYVTGHALGSTNVAVIDPLGRVIFDGEVTVTRPITTVTLYRGVDRADFSCGGSTCEGTDRADTSGAPKGTLPAAVGVSGISMPPPKP